MKRLTNLTAGIVATLALAASASATTLMINSANPVIFAAGTIPITDGGEFRAILNGTTNINVYCVDFSDQFVTGQLYNVDLSTPPSISNARLGTNTTWEYTLGGSYSAVTRYMMAAYLTTQYANAANSTVTNGIQDAIWAILDASTNLHLATNTAAMTEVTAATNWYNGISGNPSAVAAFDSRVRIYTDAGGNSGVMQEFVSVSSATPEPSSILLFAIGAALLSAGAFGKAKILNRR
jgi:hypothetical protein